MILRHHDEMIERYKKAKTVYTGLEYWENYLHLNEEA